MAFTGLIEPDRKKKKNGLGGFPAGPNKSAPGQNASDQNVDLLGLLSQPQNFGTQAASIDPGAAPIPDLTGGFQPDPSEDFGVPGTVLPQDDQGLLPPVGGLSSADMDVGVGGGFDLGGNPGAMSPVSQPAPQQVGQNPVKPLAPMQLPKRKDKGGFFNFTGSDNVFLRGAQGLEDGGILGLIGQILNR